MQKDHPKNPPVEQMKQKTQEKPRVEIQDLEVKEDLEKKDLRGIVGGNSPYVVPDIP